MLAVITIVVVLEATLAFSLFQPDNDATLVAIFRLGAAALPIFLLIAGVVRWFIHSRLEI